MTDTGEIAVTKQSESVIAKMMSWWASLDIRDCKLDPYCQLTVMQQKTKDTKKTKQLNNISDSLPALFNDVLEFNYNRNSTSHGQLLVEVWDEGPGADELIGFAQYKLSAIFSETGDINGSAQLVDLFDG